MATVPLGPSHTSPVPRHWTVEEQTVLELALTPDGYAGLPPVAVATGIFGIFPALTAAFNASVHACGVLDVSGVEEGYTALHAYVCQ